MGGGGGEDGRGRGGAGACRGIGGGGAGGVCSRREARRASKARRMGTATRRWQSTEYREETKRCPRGCKLAPKRRRAREPDGVDGVTFARATEVACVGGGVRTAADAAGNGDVAADARDEGMSLGLGEKRAESAVEPGTGAAPA